MQMLIAMRVAIPHWQGRVAPVFDVAGHLLLIDVEDGRETRREERSLVKTELTARATELRSCGVDVLICGAISAPLQLRIADSGVRVSDLICGPVEEVLAAYLNDTLASRAFAMPGCQRWRWRGSGRNQGKMRSTECASIAESNFSTCPGCGERLLRKPGKGGSDE